MGQGPGSGEASCTPVSSRCSCSPLKHPEQPYTNTAAQGTDLPPPSFFLSLSLETHSRLCPSVISMQCARLRCQHSSVGASAARQRHPKVCCLAHHQASSPCKQQQQGQHNRRAALAALLLGAAGTAARPAAAASSDLLEGTQSLFAIGSESFSLWVQKGIDSIVNDDSIGITDLEGTTRKRRFGSISVPGLSSFSFIHGALVGGAVILLLAADKLTPQQQQQQAAGDPQHPALNPEVEAALKQLLASPEVKAQFHDPAVHAALQEVRVDPRAIAKYRDDPAVMQAFSKLLEIENILERL